MKMGSLFRIFLLLEWVVLGGLVLGCSGNVSEQPLLITPFPQQDAAVSCNPITAILENPLYQGVKPYKDLFQEGFEYGCLAVTWREQKKRFPTPIKVTKEGLLYGWDTEKNQFGSTLQVRVSRGDLKEVRFRLYLVPAEKAKVSESIRNLEAICDVMGNFEKYNCFQDKAERCLLYIDFVPTIERKEMAIAELPGGKKCQLCAFETCDGQDNDCDGQTDEVSDLSPPLCANQKGVCQGAVKPCAGEKGWTKCQDKDFAAQNKKYEAGKETSCGDQVDNNCNGQTDDQDPDCECLPGKVEPCYTGPPETRKIGACHDGTKTCLPSGVWDQCKGEVKPSTEICDGKDNDCNGKTDLNDPALEKKWKSDPSLKCSNQHGVCQGSLKRCTGKSGWQDCTEDDYAAHAKANKQHYSPQQTEFEDPTGLSCKNPKNPSDTSGDKLDNNCNGQVDGTCNCNPQQTPTRKVYSGNSGCTADGKGGFSCKGICKPAEQKCELDPSSGRYRWVTQAKEVLPQQEVCDGKDNDCDGQTDNKPGSSSLLTKECYTGPAGTEGKGICKKGTVTCRGGKFGTSPQDCVGQVVPQKELCDGVDTDCDGQDDEDFPQKGKACSNGIGECLQKGVYICRGNKQGVICDAIAKNPSPERCDGKDNNCDGQVDNNPVYDTPCSKQLGVCKGSKKRRCVKGAWESCNDADYKMHDYRYQTNEACDGLDNDCNGQTDENNPGGGQPCLLQNLYGPCRTGVQTCKSGKIECTQTVQPAAKETCANGIDDNCNGKVDESPPCICQPGTSQACYSGGTECAKSGRSYTCKGICKAGLQTCKTDQTWGPCIGEVKPRQEVCNGQDDDCDGSVDESFPEQGTSCQTNLKGECKPGSYTTCKAGKLVCTSKMSPSSETCNGKDDDCDGYVDNRTQSDPQPLTRSCYSGTSGCTPQTGGSYKCAGVCQSGTSTCNNGTWSSSCPGEIKPSTEVCDGQDNDCDGQTDESFPEDKKACVISTLLGPCRNGEYECKNNKLNCKQIVQAQSSETCGNGKDDDCNGQTDESPPCTCVPGTTQPCYGAGTGCTKSSGSYSCDGICQAGLQTCKTDQTWGPCVGEIRPNPPEVCDGKDNDCNGKIDEADPAFGQDCVIVGAKGECAKGKYTTCQNGALKCTTPYTATGETCNGKDDDCDGYIDNKSKGSPTPLSQPCYSASSGCSKQTDGTYRCTSPCTAGTDTCINGQWTFTTTRVCVGEVTPVTELCDNKDNDCDGSTDESFPEQNQTCLVSGQKGACQIGQTECKNGTVGCKQVTQPVTEVCGDGTDNDCDGLVDEAPCPCKNGDTQACYTGPSGTAGVGECSAGTQTCSKNTWGACSGEVTPKPEECNNKDDDCNGLTDDNVPPVSSNTCSKQQGICSGSYKRRCVGGSWAACDQNDYRAHNASYESTETTCNDTEDNDCDGSADCADGDCDTQSCGTGCTCSGSSKTETLCSDGQDNDGDGKSDCDDADCDTQSCGTGCTCSGNSKTESNCADGQDNDGDGKSDCDDADCDTKSCGPGCICNGTTKKETACTDTQDNDGDNNIDCADSDCSNESCGPGCICSGGSKTESDCADGQDNDGDNNADCVDPDCNNESCGPGCTCSGGGKTESDCADGQDNDGDGLADGLDSDCSSSGGAPDGGQKTGWKGDSFLRPVSPPVPSLFENPLTPKKRVAWLSLPLWGACGGGEKNKKKNKEPPLSWQRREALFRRAEEWGEQTIRGREKEKS